MSCYACGTEFGFFKKEQGCKNCGFAFCSKCLTKKAPVPKETLERWNKSKSSDKEKHHVCNKCYNILTGKESAEASGRQTPPEAYLKRIAALEEREAHGVSHSSHKGGGTKVNPKYAALEKPDREIAQRLDKLKERPKEVKVSDKDLTQRLARPKGEDPAGTTASTKPVYQPPDRRTQVEQVDELLDEIANEVEIDSHHLDPAADVQNRLSKLREDKAPPKDVSKDEENNLDKPSPAADKRFVKNIDVGTGASSSNTAGSKQAGGDSDVDFAEMQALMDRAAAEMEADAQRALEGMKKDKQLMERLAEIKQRQKKKDGQTDDQSEGSNVDNTQEDNEDSEDEETAAKRIMQQYLEEAKLDDALGEDLSVGSEPKITNKSHKSKGQKDKTESQAGKKPKSSEDNDDDDYEDPDELPYCIICTEDAVIRCIDCDMDLYCNRCFRDGHKELGLNDHRSVPYKAPKGYK